MQRISHRYCLFLHKYCIVSTNFDLFICLCADVWIGSFYREYVPCHRTAANCATYFMAAFYGAIFMHYGAWIGSAIAPFYALAVALFARGGLCGSAVWPLPGLSSGTSFGPPVDGSLFSCNTYCNKNLVIDSIELPTAGQSRIKCVTALGMRKVRTPCE
jgi:hypothetical protein